MSSILLEETAVDEPWGHQDQPSGLTTLAHDSIRDMDFHELETLLDSLLAKEEFPSEIPYRSSSIHYQRQCKMPMVFQTLFKLIKTECIYRKYFLKKINYLKENRDVYNAFKKTGCLTAIHMYLYLAKIGLFDLLKSLGGRFDDTIFMNFTIATQLYDASFDVPECRKYLKDFERFVMTGEMIDSDDVVWRLFNECVDNLKRSFSEEEFDLFLRLVRIEHVSQLMSISQHSNEPLSQESLRKITFSKGGIALLTIMYLMAPHMKQKERKAIYELGGVMQIIDDIRDTKEDLLCGIQTLPNRKILDFEELKTMFAGTVNNLITQCGLNPSKRNGTLNMLCWFSYFVLEGRYRRILKVL